MEEGNIEYKVIPFFIISWILIRYHLQHVKCKCMFLKLLTNWSCINYHRIYDVQGIWAVDIRPELVTFLWKLKNGYWKSLFPLCNLNLLQQIPLFLDSNGITSFLEVSCFWNKDWATCDHMFNFSWSWSTQHQSALSTLWHRWNGAWRKDKERRYMRSVLRIMGCWLDCRTLTCRPL